MRRPRRASFLGTGILLRMGDPPRKGVMIVLANVGYSLGLAMLGLAALALSSWFYVALAVLAFLGLMDVVSFTARQALIQLVAPDYYRGRVGSFSSILAGLGNGTGSAVIGGDFIARRGARSVHHQRVHLPDHHHGVRTHVAGHLAPRPAHRACSRLIALPYADALPCAATAAIACSTAAWSPR